jgi:hypothetical protein
MVAPFPARAASVRLAAAAVLLVSLWTAVRIHYAFGGNWTAVFYTGVSMRVPAELDAGTFRITTNGYDGQFYRYLAHDPSLQKGYSQYTDAPQLRFRRCLVPLAAWLLGFGQRHWIDPAFFAVEMLFLAWGVYWCARLLARHGRSPAWGLLFVVVPGTLASFDRMLVDGPLLACFAGFLLYSDEERWGRVWITAMLASLTRETGLLLVAALVVNQLWRRDWRRASWFAASSLPALAWYGYVTARVPNTGVVSILEFPAWGLLRRLFWLRTVPDPRAQLLFRVTDVLAVLGVVLSIVLAVRWLMRSRRGSVTLCAGFFAGLALVLGSPEYMIDAFGFGRPISPLLLWIMIEAVTRRAWIALAPPLLVSLGVSVVFAVPLWRVIRGLLG